MFAQLTSFISKTFRRTSARGVNLGRRYDSHCWDFAEDLEDQMFQDELAFMREVEAEGRASWEAMSPDEKEQTYDDLCELAMQGMVDGHPFAFVWDKAYRELNGFNT